MSIRQLLIVEQYKTEELQVEYESDAKGDVLIRQETNNELYVEKDAIPTLIEALQQMMGEQS